MSDDRVSALERALSELQVKPQEKLDKLDTLLLLLLQQQQLQPTELPAQPITPVSASPHVQSSRPVVLTEFDGDHTNGVAFLNSCQTYICFSR